MMKKMAFGVLAALYGGLFESFIYGLYGYQILTFIFMALIITVCADIIILHRYAQETVSKIEASRRMGKEEMKKGDKIRVELTFTNRTKRNMHFFFFDHIPDAFTISGDYQGKINLKPGASTTKIYHIVPGIIGKYSLGPIKIVASDGLGLAYVDLSVEKYNYPKVAPSSKDVFMERSERMSNMIFTTGLHYSRKAGQGYDFYGIRQYSESDDMRHLAWNRYNINGNDDLFAKEWEEDRQIDVVFCIDYSIGSNSGHGVLRMYDTLVSAAINSAYAVRKNADKVGFIIFSTAHNYYIPCTSRKDSIEKFEKITSNIRPEGTFSMDALNVYVKKCVKKNAMVFVYSSPSYGKFTGHEDPKFMNIQKQEYYYIMNPEGFYPMPDSDSLVWYRKGVIENETESIKKSVYSIRSFGINARMVTKNSIFTTTMSDYINGREGNRGA